MRFSSDSGLRLSCAVLALLPAVHLGLVVSGELVDIPFSDDWAMLGPIRKMRAGVLGWDDVWALHNEHRMLFPKAINACIGAWTAWDARWFAASNFAAIAAVFLALAWLVRRGAGEAGRWLFPAVSVLVFSLRQGVNCVWGFQLSMLLSMAAAMGGLLVLSSGRGWARLVSAAVLGMVSSYSSAGGVLFWPIGALLLARERDPARAAAWACAAAAVIGFYLVGYASPPHHDGIMYGLRDPFAAGRFAASLLGSTMGPWAALPAGIAGLVLLACLLKNRALQDDDGQAGLAAAGLFSVGVAALTALSRAGFPPEHALSVHYAMTPVPFWAALVGLSIRRFERRAGVAVFLAVGILSLAGAADGRRSLEGHAAALRAGRTAIIRGQESPALAYVYPSAQWREAFLRDIAFLRLSVFRRR